MNAYHLMANAVHDKSSGIVRCISHLNWHACRIYESLVDLICVFYDTTSFVLHSALHCRGNDSPVAAANSFSPQPFNKDCMLSQFVFNFVFLIISLFLRSFFVRMISFRKIHCLLKPTISKINL